MRPPDVRDQIGQRDETAFEATVGAVLIILAFLAAVMA